MNWAAMANQKLPLPVLGVDLLSDETSLPEGAVRSADNFDIRRDGSFKRRDGYAVIESGADYHSLFSTERHGILVARGSSLYSLRPRTLELSWLFDTGCDGPIEFERYNDHLYLISRGAFWWIAGDDLVARRVGVAPPESIPDIEPTAAGALPAGRYSVAISRVDERGEESRAVFAGSIYCAGGGLRLSGLAIDLGASYRVYLTPPDGDTLYLSETFLAAFSEYVVTRPPAGMIRTSQHLRPMPPGDFVRGHAGRLYVADGNTLWFSEALRPHLHDPRHNFITFAGQIKFIESVEAGLLVGDEHGVVLLTGKEPEQFQQRRVSGAQPVRRSSLKLKGANFNKDITDTDMDVVVWLSTEGYMLARASGDVVSLHPERVRVAAGLEGRSRFVIRDGIKQIITLVAATDRQTYGVAIDTTLQ